VCTQKGATMRAMAGKHAAAAATARDKAKRRDHAKDGTPDYTFVPFSIESYGRLGVEANKLLKDLSNEAASTGVWERDVFLHWIRKEISLNLIRGNAQRLLFVARLEELGNTSKRETTFLPVRANRSWRPGSALPANGFRRWRQRLLFLVTMPPAMHAHTNVCFGSFE
jgi:hypothetical protein